MAPSKEAKIGETWALRRLEQRGLWCIFLAQSYAYMVKIKWQQLKSIDSDISAPGMNNVALPAVTTQIIRKDTNGFYEINYNKHGSIENSLRKHNHYTCDLSRIDFIFN